MANTKVSIDSKLASSFAQASIELDQLMENRHTASVVRAYLEATLKPLVEQLRQSVRQSNEHPQRGDFFGLFQLLELNGRESKKEIISKLLNHYNDKAEQVNNYRYDQQQGHIAKIGDDMPFAEAFTAMVRTGSNEAQLIRMSNFLANVQNDGFRFTPEQAQILDNQRVKVNPLPEGGEIFVTTRELRRVVGIALTRAQQPQPNMAQHAKQHAASATRGSVPAAGTPTTATARAASGATTAPATPAPQPLAPRPELPKNLQGAKGDNLAKIKQVPHQLQILAAIGSVDPALKEFPKAMHAENARNSMRVNDSSGVERAPTMREVFATPALLSEFETRVFSRSGTAQTLKPIRPEAFDLATIDQAKYTALAAREDIGALGKEFNKGFIASRIKSIEPKTLGANKQQAHITIVSGPDFTLSTFKEPTETLPERRYVAANQFLMDVIATADIAAHKAAEIALQNKIHKDDVKAIIKQANGIIAAAHRTLEEVNGVPEVERHSKPQSIDVNLALVEGTKALSKKLVDLVIKEQKNHRKTNPDYMLYTGIIVGGKDLIEYADTHDSRKGSSEIYASIQIGNALGVTDVENLKVVTSWSKDTTQEIRNKLWAKANQPVIQPAPAPAPQPAPAPAPQPVPAPAPQPVPAPAPQPAPAPAPQPAPAPAPQPAPTAVLTDGEIRQKVNELKAKITFVGPDIMVLVESAPNLNSISTVPEFAQLQAEVEALESQIGNAASSQANMYRSALRAEFDKLKNKIELVIFNKKDKIYEQAENLQQEINDAQAKIEAARAAWRAKMQEGISAKTAADGPWKVVAELEVEHLAAVNALQRALFNGNRIIGQLDAIDVATATQHRGSIGQIKSSGTILGQLPPELEQLKAQYELHLAAHHRVSEREQREQEAGRSA